MASIIQNCIKGRTPAANQLQDYAESVKNDPGSATMNNGCPIYSLTATESVGPSGPILTQDVSFMEAMQHFNRERIPERVVHAKGSGAFGYFEVTHDITPYCAANMFSQIGKQTPVAVRLSTVVPRAGSQDTIRDVRGFAVKFRTEEGNFDIVGNNSGIFFLRDPIMFSSFVHSLKENPVTNTRDWDMLWDFFSNRPETMHQFIMLYTDRGTPDGYRHMNGFGANTFTMTNQEGATVFAKFHFKPVQGIKNLMYEDAVRIAGENPDYAHLDLYNSIGKGDYPIWTLYIQIMTPEQAQTHPVDPFDATKVWKHAEYPLIPVGKMVLNKNPTNYFAEVEQMAFAPSNLVPGIGASPDRVFQARLFAYSDSQLYRLGVNNKQLPVNCPFRMKNYHRDGFATINNQGGAPKYFPNSFNGPQMDVRAMKLHPHLLVAAGNIEKFERGEEDNYSQPRDLVLRVLSLPERTRLIQNIVRDLKNANTCVQAKCIQQFSKVDALFGSTIAAGLTGAMLHI